MFIGFACILSGDFCSRIVWLLNLEGYVISWGKLWRRWRRHWKIVPWCTLRTGFKNGSLLLKVVTVNVLAHISLMELENLLFSYHQTAKYRIIFSVCCLNLHGKKTWPISFTAAPFRHSSRRRLVELGENQWTLIFPILSLYWSRGPARIVFLPEFRVLEIVASNDRVWELEFTLGIFRSV